MDIISAFIKEQTEKLNYYPFVHNQIITVNVLENCTLITLTYEELFKDHGYCLEYIKVKIECYSEEQLTKKIENIVKEIVSRLD